MKVLVVSGIWPPDVGGPASHAPEVAEFLSSRGDEVAVVTTAEAPPAARPYPVAYTSRRLPLGLRHAHGAMLIARRAAKAEVVYSTGLFARTALGASMARRPFVVKLTGDPAFERARARGWVRGDVDSFQRSGAVPVLRTLRNAALRRAAAVVCPSAYLRDLAVSWGIPPERVTVLPNPSPSPPPLASRDALRRGLGIEGPALAFAGRLTAQKSLEIAFGAVARSPGVELLVAGEGPERERLERAAPPGVRFLGPLSRQAVLELFAAADAAVLSSTWENFPHTVVEALSVGTPVISTTVGGVGEVLQDGVNALLVPPADPEALARAIRRFFAEDELRERLRAAAAASVAGHAPERVYAKLAAVLESAVSRT